MLQYLQPIQLQKTQSNLFNKYSIDVLRTDLIHSIVSGNKWYKLKYYLQDAINSNKKTIATFGGAFSNHIVATAYASKELNLASFGIIRGEESESHSHTLQAAKELGMKLFFVGRSEYKNKHSIKENFDEDIYWINEGGYGKLGMLGAADILKECNYEGYTHIFCSCGTGTMLAGLIYASKPNQTVLGISVMKNNFSLIQETENLLPLEKKKTPNILHDYHFGGYAKRNNQLLDFMNELYVQEKIPTDFVYSGKLFFALHDLCNKHFFKQSDKILAIHCGGLQGNLTLPKNSLCY